MATDLIAKKRYNDIKKRHFVYILELCILDNIKKSKISSSCNQENFETKLKEFAETLHKNKLSAEQESLIECYKALRQGYEHEGILIQNINDLRNEITGKSKRAQIGIKFLENLYGKDTCKNFFISLEDFKGFFLSNNKGCGYCGITQAQIDKLIANDSIYTKRLSTRGKTFEVDQKKPNQGYTKDNIILSCYWCNNAKSDEFSLEEFYEISEKINAIFSTRLNEKIALPKR